MLTNCERTRLPGRPVHEIVTDPQYTETRDAVRRAYQTQTCTECDSPCPLLRVAFVGETLKLVCSDCRERILKSEP